MEPTILNWYRLSGSAKRMGDRLKYLQNKLQDFSLEEIFEQFDLDPEDTLLRMHTLGLVDIDYYMDDELVEDDETDVEE